MLFFTLLTALVPESCFLFLIAISQTFCKINEHSVVSLQGRQGGTTIYPCG